MSVVLFVGCSSVRHVPDGQLLLNSISITSNDTTGSVDKDHMLAYVRQLPNHKFLWSTKFQLGVYNLSGNDTTKWWNRWIRRMGEAPVIYDPDLTDKSVAQLRQALYNKGFLSAEVMANTVSKPGSKKMDVTYILNPGEPHIIKNIGYDIVDDAIDSIVRNRLRHSVVREGDLLDMGLLDGERLRIATDLRNRGYFSFSKDYITFIADTTQGSTAVDLTIRVNAPYPMANADSARHIPSYINNVYVIINYDPARMLSDNDFVFNDTIVYNDINILSNGRSYLRPNVIDENCYIRRGEP